MLDLLLEITLADLESANAIPPSPDALDALLTLVREQMEDPEVSARRRDWLQEVEAKLAAACATVD